MTNRAEVLLYAAYDVLKQCDNSNYVLNALEVITHYDDAECDGFCLMEDIEAFLELEVQDD